MKNVNYNKDTVRQYLSTAWTETKQKKDYVHSLNSLPSVKTKGFSDFFIDLPITINYRYSHQTILVNDQSFYLSLYERTTNFSKTPANEHTKLIGNALFVKTDFEISQELSCKATVIFYDEKGMIDSARLNHNKGKFEQLIRTPDKAVSFRVALKLDGKGTFQNKQLLIEQRVVFPAENHSDLTIGQNGKTDSNLVKQQSVKKFKQKLTNYKYRRKIKTNNLKVASILDEFSHECFKYDCDLLPLSKENWQADLDKFNPDFLLVESCWQGNKGEWAYEVANLHINHHRKKLKELTAYCKKSNIKTVFWDKEGAENFNFFKEASAYFDYIFTADENNIDNYKAYTKNDHVFVLAFAAQPQIHNPIYKGRNYMGQVGFAGSYYNNKHELRKKDIESIIKPALKHDIHIYDRYFDADPKAAPNNQWPDEYRDNIVGKLDYPQMVEAYKNYDIFLNVNSVQDSKYMFARRVFEVLSSGSLVISGPSIGVEAFFEKLVPVVRTKEETEKALKVYTKNAAVRTKLVKEAARYVLQNHTYRNRLQEICDQIGLDKDLLHHPKVSIITSTQREEFLNDLYDNIKNQTYSNIEVLLVLNKNNMNAGRWRKKFQSLPRNVQIIQLDEELSLGHCLNEAIQRSSGEIIAKFDDDDYYAPNYVTDMVLSMDYSNADIVGKSSHYLHFESNNLLAVKTIGAGQEAYSDFVAGATLVFTREVFDKLNGFVDKNRGEDSDFLKRSQEAGFSIYSNDVTNYCCYRRADKENHTWKIEDEDLLRSCTSHIYTSDTKSPVTF